MNTENLERTAAQRYDRALHVGRSRRPLPAGEPVPQPTSAWPAENISLLARYWVWLVEENSSKYCIEQVYIPMAGYVLGLNLKAHSHLDLEKDLEKAMAYIQAKQLSPSWTESCRLAVIRFRRFLRYERGLLVDPLAGVAVCLGRYQAGLPDWFIQQMTQLQHLRQANWRPSRLRGAIRRFWSSHTRLWRWLFAQEGITAPRQVKRRHLFAYMDERLAAGYAAKSVNLDLRTFQATLRFLQERGFHIPLSLFRLPMLKEPDALPRFLTDDEVRRLQVDFEQRVIQAVKEADRCNALLDRACFYLLWHAGLRLGEVEDLCRADLNLFHRQLVIRQGKDMRDRTVYLTDVAAAALAAYLAVRGNGQTDHVFLYRHRPLCKGLIHGRLKQAGVRTGVKVTAHRLRHTCATQLVNAGCPITTIKEILGHQRLNSTLVYARVHDRTVAEDYFSAMAVIERRLEPHLNRPGELTATKNGSVHRDNKEDGHHLIALIESLNRSAADENQKAIIKELRRGLLALVE